MMVASPAESAASGFGPPFVRPSSLEAVMMATAAAHELEYQRQGPPVQIQIHPQRQQQQEIIFRQHRQQPPVFSQSSETEKPEPFRSQPPTTIHDFAANNITSSAACADSAAAGWTNRPQLQQPKQPQPVRPTPRPIRPKVVRPVPCRPSGLVRPVPTRTPLPVSNSKPPSVVVMSEDDDPEHDEDEGAQLNRQHLSLDSPYQIHENGAAPPSGRSNGQLGGTLAVPRIVRPHPSTVLIPRDDDAVEDGQNKPQARASHSGTEPVRSASDAPKPPAGLVRPVPLKVVRPIPKQASEAFYELAHEAGWSGQQVQEVVMQSHDWHRKWTQQDEEGHTMPDTVQPTDGRASGTIPTAYAYQPDSLDEFILDRCNGARNPSPGGSGSCDNCSARWNGGNNKRGLGDGQILGLSSMEPPLHSEHRRDEEDGARATKRRFQLPQSPKMSQDEPVLVRPTPLRIARPVPLRPADMVPPAQEDEESSESDDRIPRNVIRVLRKEPNSNVSDESVAGRSMSPLTVYSASTSRSARSAKSQIMGTQLQEQVVVRTVSPSPLECVVESPPHVDLELIEQTRGDILHALACCQGDAGSLVTNPKDKKKDPTLTTPFEDKLDVLRDYYQQTGVHLSADGDYQPQQGTWLTLTKPTFFGCLGENDAGDPMYTLGRMAFDMFVPSQLVCSLQGNFNIVRPVKDAAEIAHVPKALLPEVEAFEPGSLYTYHIITAFTIEPPSAAWPTAPNQHVRRPIRGIMTTEGFTLPDPETPHRRTVWITGGRIEPNDSERDRQDWINLFGRYFPVERTWGEAAKLLAVKMLMGAEVPTEMDPATGRMEYVFTRPLGGHGMAYVDTLYTDKSLRILRGHRGTVFVFTKTEDLKE